MNDHYIVSALVEFLHSSSILNEGKNDEKIKEYCEMVIETIEKLILESNTIFTSDRELMLRTYSVTPTSTGGPVKYSN